MLHPSAPPTSSNPWFAVSLGLAGLMVGYVFGSASGTLPSIGGRGGVAQTPPPPPPAAQASPADVDDDPVLGDKRAKVTLIEFTDYQCPFCARHFTQTHGQIVQNYVDTGKVKIVVRDFPLSFHPNAQKAAEATECADEQGKFWEMHDKLFESQQMWSGSTDIAVALKAYAKDLGLDAGDFADCLDSGEMADEVQKDLADGSKAGVSGTPGFWVVGPDGKGQLISGAFPYATFQAAFDELL